MSLFSVSNRGTRTFGFVIRISTRVPFTGIPSASRSLKCSPFELDWRIRENGVQTNGGDDGITTHVETGREARGGVGDAPGPGAGGRPLPPAGRGAGPGVPMAGRLP